MLSRPGLAVATTSPTDEFSLELSPEQRSKLIAELAELEPELAAELGVGPLIRSTVGSTAPRRSFTRTRVPYPAGPRRLSGRETIGTAAVQLAKHFGAQVTAVCNGKNVDLVRSLGADEVIDYERQDFTKNGETYDVVFDAVGKHSFRRSRRSLKPGGTFVETDLGFMWHVPAVALASRWVSSKRLTLPIPKYSKHDVLLLEQLMEAGTYRGVIDRRYPLEDVVEATRYVETGQKTGNVVLTVT